MHEHPRGRSRKLKATIAAGVTAAVVGGCATDSEVVHYDLGATIEDAYHFAYPLYELSRHRWQALETAGGRTSTTLNNFAHSRELAGPDDTWANAPIQDALYSTAWLDLAEGPVFLDTPDTASRYYVLTLNDFYTGTFFYAGTRTTGTEAQKYLVVGPGWSGTAPQDVEVVQSPTNDVYVNLRLQTDGGNDLTATHVLQDGFRFTTAENTNPKTPARIEPKPDSPENYLAVVNQMMSLDPPFDADPAELDRFRSVGICGDECSWDALPEETKHAWREKFPQLGNFMQALVAGGRKVGWVDSNPPGSPLGSKSIRDYKYRARALSTALGMIGLTREEANYWITFTDEDQSTLRGDRRYVLGLPEGGIPAESFWSVALYEVRKDGQFPSPNPIGRYAVTSRSPGLVTNPDGTIDIWIQPEATDPGRYANWLPSPADGKNFILFARSYIPGAEVIAGEFVMPPVKPA